jgi:hypothetical protein
MYAEWTCRHQFATKIKEEEEKSKQARNGGGRSSLGGGSNLETASLGCVLGAGQNYPIPKGGRDVIKDDFGGKLLSGRSRTSARVRVYPADVVLPADGFLPSADAVKTASARTLGCVCVDAHVRADASSSLPFSLPPLPSPPLPPLPPSPLLSARTRKK